MKLHEDTTTFRQALQATSDQMQILPIYVEKDYWVTYALYAIFNHTIGKDTVFKGGTALSKCYQLIDRFSEDIDLVVLRRDEESNNKLTSKIKTIGKVVDSILPEVSIDGLTHKMGMNRKTAHTYNKEFVGNYGQVRDSIVIEATWLGYHEPFTVKTVSSFVGQMMMKANQGGLVEQYGLLPFEVNVLEPIRTICEKIMSLVRFSYDEDPFSSLKKKVRHVYDLHKLLEKKDFKLFLNSQAFDQMLLKVAKDDLVSFKNNNDWLKNHPKNSLIFNQSDAIWNHLSSPYLEEFGNLVYGDLPSQKLMLDTLKMISKRLKSIEWNVHPGKS